MNQSHLIQTCTLLTANTPAAVGDLYRFASSSTEDVTKRLDVKARLDVAAKMREAALKSSIFVGVPRVSKILNCFLYATRA